MTYRPEIDGLRALAVVPVILFHAGLPQLGGGFVGVDIFFVISGYLITTILITDLAQGRFSLLRFYERRARRILPALCVMMAVCVPFAWAWLMPRDLVDFAQSVIATATFSSNILFWRESGYFDTATELKPLLHTWSLAVEEQYYIFFPLALMLFWSWGRRWLLGILGGVAVLSFAVALWGVKHEPSATFYLLPTRGWELLAGAFAAFYLQTRPPAWPRALRETGALLGTAMILFAIFTYDKSTPFPGAHALPPVLGTVLIILCTTGPTWVGQGLSLRPLVGIGLISYSAYLWHQPLFAFARYRSLEEPGLTTLAGLCALTLGLAWLSWRYVEQPFRGKRFSRPQILSASVVSLAGFGLLGGWAVLQSGFVDRLPADQKQILAFETYPRQGPYREGTCFLLPDQDHTDFAPDCGQPGAPLLWGDSHAAALYPGLSQDQILSQFNASACPPLLDLDLPEQPHCAAINRFVMDFVARAQPERLYLHATWSDYSEADIRAGLTHTLTALRAHSPDSRVVVIGGVPHWGKRGLPNRILRHGLGDGTGLRAGTHLPAELDTVQARDAVLREVAPKGAFVSLTDRLCEGTNCVALIEEDGHVAPIAWDYGHLTKGGSLYTSAMVLDAVAGQKTP